MRAYDSTVNVLPKHLELLTKNLIAHSLNKKMLEFHI